MSLKKLIGVSEHINGIRDEIDRIAKSDSTVLIEGPTGTGKELIANNIHYKSQRKNELFEIVNCGAIPHDLFESELFGHKRGAFTGAHADKKGKVEIANGGTLFLDEIGDLATDQQVKILRFLEDGSFSAVGGTETFETNVRVIAATNKDLLEQIKTGNFREDLYFRLNQYPIYTKSLFERPEDLVILVNHFIFESKLNVDDRVKFLLYSYNLPGNVRELKSILGWTYDQVREYLGQNLAQQQKEIHDSPKEPDVLSNQKRFSPIKPEIPKISDPKEINREKLEEALKFSAKKNVDFEKTVRAYEIIQLREKINLSQEKIAGALHIRKNSLSPKKFKKRFGFEASSKDCKYHLRSPIDLYNKPVSLDEYKNKLSEKYGYSEEELDILHK